jgi:DNA-binding CsgD family transcriptional regulator
LTAELAHGGRSVELGRVGVLIRSGAELVHLAEMLYLRLFRLVMLLTAIGALLSLWFGGLEAGKAPAAATAVFAGIGVSCAAIGFARTREVYCWLRYNRVHQVAPAALAIAAVAFNGADSPSWWVALPMLWVIADVGSMALAVSAGVMSAAAYISATVAGGTPLIHHGDAGILGAAVALPINAAIGAVAAEQFARFVLALGRLQAQEHTPTPPRRVTIPVDPPAPQGRPLASTVREPPEPATRLTARQLEALLLARDGLLQAEIASCLGISSRQVERLMHAARKRVGATTTSELIALLVSGRLVPAPPGDARAGGDTKD